MRRPFSYLSPTLMRRVRRLFAQSLGYQLLVAAVTIPAAAPAIAALAIAAPVALPGAALTVVFLIAIRSSLLVRDVNSGRLPPPTEFESRASAVEAAVGLTATAIYTTTLIGIVVALTTIPPLTPWVVWVAMGVTLLDRELLDRGLPSPAALPVRAFIRLLVAAGILRSDRGDWMHGYSWSRRPRRPA